MLHKKMNDLTVGESLKLSAIITAVCFIPTVVYFGYQWYRDMQYTKEFDKQLKKAEEEQ